MRSRLRRRRGTRETATTVRDGDRAAYLAHALHGDRNSAVDLVRDLLDRGVPGETVVEELLAPAQREVGTRWARNEVSIADEHVTTGVTAAVLDALIGEPAPASTRGHAVVVCAEGDWHGMGPHMLGCVLSNRGVRATILGASTPAEVVGSFLAREAIDVLAVSCSQAIHALGVHALVEVGHDGGVPVIVGGRGLRSAAHATRLGADGWAPTAASAADLVARLVGGGPPALSPLPPLDPDGVALVHRADPVAAGAMARLIAEHPDTAERARSALARLGQDLSTTVRFVAASLILGDDRVALDHVEWLIDALGHRGIDAAPLAAVADLLVERVTPIDPRGGRLLDACARMLRCPLTG